MQHPLSSEPAPKLKFPNNANILYTIYVRKPFQNEYIGPERKFWFKGVRIFIRAVFFGVFRKTRKPRFGIDFGKYVCGGVYRDAVLFLRSKGAAGGAGTPCFFVAAVGPKMPDPGGFFRAGSLFEGRRRFPFEQGNCAGIRGAEIVLFCPSAFFHTEKIAVEEKIPPGYEERKIPSAPFRDKAVKGGVFRKGIPQGNDDSVAAVSGGPSDNGGRFFRFCAGRDDEPPSVFGGCGVSLVLRKGVCSVFRGRRQFFTVRFGPAYSEGGKKIKNPVAKAAV